MHSNNALGNSYKNDIPYLPIKDIDFTSARGKKSDDRNGDNTSSARYHTLPSVRLTEAPSSPELKPLFQNLNEFGSKPVILSLIPDNATSFIQKQLPSFPPLLQLLSKPLTTLN